MRVGIIGGGTLGLTLALRLGRRGHEVTVLEAAPQTGGLATWFDFGEFTWDKYYHVVLQSDANLLALFDELGLAPRLRWVQTQSGFLWQGRHLSMSSNWEFLTFPALGLFEKLRLGLGILYCQRIRDPAPLERETAAAWMSRIFGRRVYSAIWEPLLQSKYGVLAEQVPATIMWSTITRYYSTRSRGGGRETLGYLSGGGLRGFFEALESAVGDAGGRVLCDQRVESVVRAADGGLEVYCGAAPLRFDRVISTLPTRQLRRIAPDLVSEPREAGPEPRFLGVIRVALVLRRPLSPYYITNLIQKGFPFTGIIEISSLVDPKELGGRAFVMLPRYEVPESEWFQRRDEQVVAEFLDALEPVWPDIRENVITAHVHREPIVQALWIDSPPAEPHARRSTGDLLWNVNAELAGRDTLNNNAIVGVANRTAAEFVAAHEAAP